MNLYHFTHKERLPVIKKHGIAKGDVPTTPSGGFNAPWFTDDPAWSRQQWAGGSVVDKSEVRLLVDIPDDDPNLRHWPELAREEGVEDWWYEQLDKVAGGGSENWYVYRGVVPWDWVHAIDFKLIDLPPGTGKTFGHNSTSKVAQRVLEDGQPVDDAVAEVFGDDR